MKITMHYNGDGKYEMNFRGVTRCDPKYGNFVFVSASQMKRLERAQIGSGPDGTVGHATFSVDGQPVYPVVI